MPPAPQSLQSSGLTLSETSIGSFKRRKRKSIIVTVLLLIVSVLILIFGLAATTRTQNITVGGYYPGVILGFGSFLGIIGAHLIENKRQMLVASIVFISFGVVAAFCCAIVDGVFAARHIDLRPLYAGRCEYHSSETSSERDVPCHTSSRSPCNLRVKSNTCYCCDLYNCGKLPLLPQRAHQNQRPSQLLSCLSLLHPPPPSTHTTTLPPACRRTLPTTCRAPTCSLTRQVCQMTPSLEPVTCGQLWSLRATHLHTTILMKNPHRTAPNTAHSTEGTSNIKEMLDCSSSLSLRTE
ncbi:transmembrane protein 255A isoform X5 [Notolabrus celidotus]|uniref:transmembrane protein 255A isoform X5 n=1 Tax=Notolabrus celidotus TaxID=1203425 RepID=UPI00148F5290|nr:transmembrane protein 255A isoform X5 [Notolabrus celidotus]